MSDKELSGESVIAPAGVGKHFRSVVRFVCLVGAVLCLLPVGGKDALLPLVPAISSFVAVVSIVAARTIRPILLPGLVAALIALFRHRWFCRWACPAGLCLDGASSLGRYIGRKPCHTMSVGQWVFALTLGGAVLGYPLFLWCDPLALFAGLFLVTEPDHLLNGGVSFLLLAMLVVFSLLWPQIWCRSLCPLGAFQDLLFRMFRLLRPVPRPATDAPRHHPSGHPVSRRTIFGLLTGAASAKVLRLTGQESSQPPRPPGAADELILRGLCTRCGNCIRSCPYGIIRRDTGQHGLTGILAPVLTFEEDYCRENCVRCTRVCPSGALVGVDLKDKPGVHIGLAQVDMNLCLLGEDRECSACMRWCPYEAIRYVFSEVEYTLVPLIDPGRCNGCGACEKACPTGLHKAIRVFSNSE